MANFPNYEQEKQLAQVNKWHKTINDSMKSSFMRHKCFLEYQHLLKNFATLVRTSNFKDANPKTYNEILDMYALIAKQSTDLSFMVSCLEDQGQRPLEITNTRKCAIASLVSLDDKESFSFLKGLFSSGSYEHEVQRAIADGLIKYLPAHNTKEDKADLILKIAILKRMRKQNWETGEFEHLLGQCVDFPSLNTALNALSNNDKLLEEVLDDNLDYWRQVRENNLPFAQEDTSQNIAILKKIGVEQNGSNTEKLIFNTLCEIVPYEALAICNERFSKKDVQENLLNMLKFRYAIMQSFNGKSTEQMDRFSSLSNSGEILENTRKMARQYLENKLEFLTPEQQAHLYEYYAVNYPEQLHAFFLRRCNEGNASAEFYEKAINATLWMIEQKRFSAKEENDLIYCFNHLLYTARKHPHYKQIFSHVFSNLDNHALQLNEMQKAAKDVHAKADFMDCLVTIWGSMGIDLSSMQQVAASNANFRALEDLLSSCEIDVSQKILHFLQNKKIINFLLEKSYVCFFQKGKCHDSLPHIVMAGDICEKHLAELKKSPELLSKYKKLFMVGIEHKADDISLACMDYYLRIENDSAKINDARARFKKRWPVLKDIPRSK